MKLNISEKLIKKKFRKEEKSAILFDNFEIICQLSPLWPLQDARGDFWLSKNPDRPSYFYFLLSGLPQPEFGLVDTNFGLVDSRLLRSPGPGF